MNWPGPERWEKLWRAIGATGNPSPWYEQLSRAYGEAHRSYHNQQHIAECLMEFDAARHLAEGPDTVELALWFHDAIYDSRRSDNEERSAALAKRCLETAGLPQLSATVSNLVIATKHDGETGTPDTALVVDIDLSILGKPESRFEEYERQVREEYDWVPLPVFNSKRAELLDRFLARKQIYRTKFFAERYEQSARRNLARSIQILKQFGDTKGHPD